MEDVYYKTKNRPNYKCCNVFKPTCRRSSIKFVKFLTILWAELSLACRVVSQVLRISSATERSAPTALDKIRNSIIDNWKDMRRELRTVDPSGLVTTDHFRQALRNIKVDLDEEDFFDIAVHFEDHKTRKIRYDDFFRCLLQSSQ